MKYFGLAAIAIWAVVSLVVPPNASAQTVNVVVNDGGQAATNVSVVFLAANTIKPPTVATPSDSNQSNFTLNLSNVIKAKETVSVQIVVRKCENGKEVVYVVEQGATVPPPDERCKEGEKCKCEDRKRVGGYIPLGSGDTITVTIRPDSVDAVVTHTGVGGGGATGKPPSHLIWVQVGGGLGLKKYSNANNCQSILNVLTGATCSSGDKSVAGGVEGTLGITPYFGFGGDYTRAGRTSRSADTPTFSENSTLGTQFETITGQVFLPLKFVTLSAEGGAAFSQFRETEKQTLTSGGTPSTVVTNLHNNTVGPEIGARVQIPITSHIAAQIHYFWVRAENKPSLNEHDNVILFGIVVRLP